MTADGANEIVNPRTGQRMRFERDGETLVIHTFNQAGEGSMTEPVHVHPFQRSSWQVLEGRIVLEIDDREVTLAAGQSREIPAGVPHRYRTDGCDVRSIQRFTPALDTQRFFETWFALGERGEIGERGLPRPLRLAQLVWRFRREIRTSSPPWPVQVAFALALLPVARLRLGSSG